MIFFQEDFFQTADYYKIKLRKLLYSVNFCVIFFGNTIDFWKELEYNKTSVTQYLLRNGRLNNL